MKAMNQTIANKHMARIFVFSTKQTNQLHDVRRSTFHGEKEFANKQQEEGHPWFIRQFRGKYVVLEKDFVSITGIDVSKHKLFYSSEFFTGGYDYNCWICNGDDKHKFKETYGFDYGEDECMRFLFPPGVLKAIGILEQDKRMRMDAKELLFEGLQGLLVWI